MGTASSRLVVPYPTSVAESLWYDPSRWPNFIDGFSHLVKVADRWPAVGAEATWDSHPGGRGRVLEKVTAYEPRVTCVLEVEDESIRGTQTIQFEPREGGTTVTLSLKYDVKARSVFTPVVDLLFVRRAQAAALQRTLHRFANELRGDQELLA